ncbi:type I glyceraldehyde-3-phosphate dehydrogenase [Echinicola strongylocentroti]|uniref:Glyceraldehyde-3-phosphate dehydrogenase n=1 Tax=Echinicola strongylocentroti TaxID=1795355 RepID=A0A2Z4IPM3_9BACT|nr:type I glyceraldehyde-3-phosphate dehydrogenase [Echinicola strongylocentroti]AWW32506.1 type I glyceraldehyde-3-phosphate dehydrogenase [Echinicola strongylocentroti]
MTKVNVAINGFGRIGRYVFKLLQQHPKINVVAINDLMDITNLAHLLKYDSVHGKFQAEITPQPDSLLIDGKTIQIYGKQSPSKLPWKELDVDIVVECTGRFVEKKKAEGHLQAGAKRVIISAPALGDVPTVVLGVNDAILTGNEPIVSNASCTTNCLAPMVKVLEDHFGIEKGFVSTVHSYTADQNLQDAPHRDLRRARAAACSIIPTTTNAAKAVELVLPQIKGKLHAMAYRVPVPDGSLTEMNVLLKRATTKEEINKTMLEAANSSMKGYIEYTEAPLVSVDIIGNPHSCIFDASLTEANGALIKIIGWYDNESGYANRVVDLIGKISRFD